MSDPAFSLIKLDAGEHKRVREMYLHGGWSLQNARQHLIKEKVRKMVMDAETLTDLKRVLYHILR